MSIASLQKEGFPFFNKKFQLKIFLETGPAHMHTERTITSLVIHFSESSTASTRVSEAVQILNGR